ncbi:MAG: molybdopterin-binding protein [Bacillota bacterium]
MRKRVAAIWPLRSFALIATLARLAAAMAIAADPPSTQPHVEYMIVVTGGELLSGIYPDSHTHFLTKTLTPLGLRCAGAMTVDDRPTDIKEAIRFCRAKVPLVIVTGGLGPTDNDLTRETISEATGIPLHEHAEVLQDMLRRFNVKLDQLRPNLRRQAQMPVRGTYLKNPNGTANGLVFDLADGVVVALPGPPRELQPMVRDELVPFLSKRFGTHLPGCSLTVRFVGIGQSQISQTLRENVPWGPEITLNSQFEGGRVDFTFSLPDDTPRGREQLNELKDKILKHLGDYVYATDETSLEEHVTRLLAARGTTLTLVEVGSGGSLAARFSSADTACKVLGGAYAAASEEKVKQMLPVATSTRVGAALSDEEAVIAAIPKPIATGWVILVGELQQDKNGSRYVNVVYRLPDGSLDKQRIAFRGDEAARSGLATQIWDHLRRRLR